ncbi:DUF6285 domain-containing protein [Pelagibius sp. CAU 1746]|uniref:DUF6285 domain-containing protein n=1 Tax=Pelagibius sp. CAU 1746 TaxID=3140370 RepID=UPI00325BCBFE
MSAEQGKGGGEAGSARLLHLARGELLDKVLPDLEGDARYSVRLIANAIKIAAQDMARGAEDSAATAHELETFAEAMGDVAVAGPQEAREAIRDALRRGDLDGSPDLYELLEEITRRRGARLA